MKIWGFWRTEGADSDQNSEEDLLASARARLKNSQFLTDVQDTFPERNRANAKRLLLFLLIFLVYVAIFASLIVLLPVEDFEEFFEAFGYTGVFFANFFSSMGVILPTPPGSAVTIVVAAAEEPLWAGLAAGIGGTLGEFTAYYVGFGGERFLNLRERKQYEVADRWMNNYGGAAITFFAFFPLFIFDFIGIAAGALKYPFHKFMIFSLLGRVPRALIEAYAGATFIDLIAEQLPDWINVPFVD